MHIHTNIYVMTLPTYYIRACYRKSTKSDSEWLMLIILKYLYKIKI